MPASNVLAYPTETIIAEKAEAMANLGRSNTQMKDVTDVAIAARRTPFDGATLVAAIQATFGCRGTELPSGLSVLRSRAMASRVGPWWSNASWDTRKDAVSIIAVLVILAFCLWKAFFP